ncbi:MAG TPA: hypothetical protein VM866_04005 [Pyrinomonadaceae bacterium]|nr:hypothetical protein [Pyrinomonadaceae bacterium]
MNRKIGRARRFGNVAPLPAAFVEVPVNHRRQVSLRISQRRDFLFALNLRIHQRVKSVAHLNTRISDEWFEPRHSLLGLDL